LRALAFLGPQRFKPTLARAVAALGVTGDLATVTAGWQERELEVEELHDHLGGRAVNLELHRRAERVFASDPEFADAHHRRQELFREMQEIYVLRLDSALNACALLDRRPGHALLLDEEREAALEAVRTVDASHFARLAEVHEEFEARWTPLERSSIALERSEITSLMARVEGLAIAGGHVAVLVNRLRMFGVAALAGDKPVLAWSGGAMACASQVVLFHDHPPFGSGNAQVLDHGLGLEEALVFLPHARRRLDLSDASKLSRFARRMRGRTLAVLEDGAILTWRAGSGWTADEGCLAVGEDGALVPMRIAIEAVS